MHSTPFGAMYISYYSCTIACHLSCLQPCSQHFPGIIRAPISKTPIHSIPITKSPYKYTAPISVSTTSAKIFVDSQVSQRKQSCTRRAILVRGRRECNVRWRGLGAATRGRGGDVPCERASSIGPSVFSSSGSLRFTNSNGFATSPR